MSKSRWWLLGLLAAPALAWGQGADDFDWELCRNGGFTNTPVEFALAKVNVPRLHFLEDTQGCPQQGGAACRQKAYVVEGDTVVLAQHQGQYVCAYYPDKKGGGSAGWVVASDVQPLPRPDPLSLDDWAGVWMDGDNKLKLGVGPDSNLLVSGEAWWPSLAPDPKVFPGGPNTGAVEGRARPKGNHWALAESESQCRIRAQALGEVMVVADNLQCGGMNVTFNGVYHRKL